MPSLFNRRSRSVSTSRPTTPASSSAHLAAAQAFMASQKPDSKLSASAAAAALRTMSPTPTPVDQIQTKRMLSRQSSNASATNNASRGRSMGSLQRRTSGGSMTERTFRSPSPGKPGSQGDLVSGVGRGTAPPVPRVPETYHNIPPLPAKAHRRSASMDTPPLRVTSPTNPRQAGRGPSTDRNAPVVSPAAAAARRSVNVQPSPTLQRSDSQDDRNSINFSYPRGSRPNSPPPRSPLAGKGETLPSPATNGISATEAAQIQNKLTQTAAKPVKKKKKRVDQSAAEGSHLNAGTMGAKPTVTPLEPASLTEQDSRLDTQPVKKTKKKAALTGQSSHFPESEEAAAASDVGSDSDMAADLVVEKRAQRASGMLMKQPSVVREDWEGEQEEQMSSPVEAAADEPLAQDEISGPGIPAQSKRSAPEANMSRKIGDPANAPKSTSGIHDAVTLSSSKTREANKALSPTAAETAAGRGASISPSRSTRFSDRLASDLAAGRKHEPLGRSISPAKSALKHASPAASEASPTAHGFPQRRGSSVTPSEASDASTDGISRKKSLRVSFEALPLVIDPVAEAPPSKESSKKGWFGLGKNKSSSQGAMGSSDEVEEGMKPRPALPSFGSVRRSERSVSPAAKEATAGRSSNSVQSASSSETSSVVDPPTMDTSISSDHALGGVLFKESQRNTNPLPPQVTSVEGTGYASDTDSLSSDDEHERPFHAARAASRQLDETISSSKSDRLSSEAIPAIAVQPATPGLDEDKPIDEWAADVPGGFPASTASSDTSSKTQSAPTTSSDNTGLGLRKSLQSTTSDTAPIKDVGSGSGNQQLMTIEEEDSDDSSLYSDAAEDLSDLEGDGFGSINAIVESPMVATPQQRVIAIPDSPLASSSNDSPMDSGRLASWDDTQAHWSGLAQRFRDKNQESEPTVKAPVENVETQPAPVVQKKIKKSRKDTAAVPITPVPKSVPEPAVVKQSRPLEPKRAVNGSSPLPTDATKRSSVNKTQGHLRTSMRGEPEPVIAPPQKRLARTAESSAAPPTKAQIKTAPAIAAPKPLPRRFSNDSDSDSSFKRARRRGKPADGKYTMKRSMRGGPAEPERSSAPANRGGVRSMSPVDRRPLSPSGVRSMRMSMRGSGDLNTPTLRGQPESKRSSSLFSRNRKAKSPTRPSTAISATSKLKSRFADSDDEDGPRPAHYKSRFADSSDEDEPKSLRPVRGIPKRNDDRDSTDLDDSSDDQKRKSKPTAQKKLTIVPPPPAEEVASPPLSPTTAKKRGLWARFRGKKKDEAEFSVPTTIAQRENTKDDIEASKTKSKDSKQLGFNSAAERDALIEQTRLKLEAAKERPTSPVNASQRRIAPHRVLSDSWAPPKMPAAMEDRPSTSGEANGASRPEIGDRRPTSETLRTDGGTPVYGKNGKKKKFPFLRKAFGLND